MHARRARLDGWNVETGATPDSRMERTRFLGYMNSPVVTSAVNLVVTPAISNVNILGGGAQGSVYRVTC